MLGNSAKSLFSNVDLPVPEGPDTTTGRNFWTIPGYYVCFLAKRYIISSLGRNEVRTCTGSSHGSYCEAG